MSKRTFHKQYVKEKKIFFISQIYYNISLKMLVCARVWVDGLVYIEVKNYTRPCLDIQIHLQIPLCKKKIPHHIKMPAHIWSTKLDEIKNQLHIFIVLCETNILSLINQCLDNYYQIKIKLLQCSTVNQSTPIR
jgi:hypothetical protein